MRFFYILFSFFVAVQAFAHQPVKPADSGRSLAVSFAVDKQDRLWRVGVNQGFVEVSFSQDVGKTFSQPIRVNKDKQTVTARGEMRPKIAIGHNGEIYVVWMQALKQRGASYIWFARSVNQGVSFEQAIIVHQDHAEIGREFEEIAISANGQVTVLWLDERDLAAKKLAGKASEGSAIYYAVSQDAGKSFLTEQVLAYQACECCRLATTTKPDGTVVTMWRHVFEGNERDHMIAEIPKAAETVKLTRATFGRWKLDGCPYHGAALARGGEGADWWGYHMAYFDGKEKKPGLYYSRMDGEAWVTFPAKRFGDNTKQARHPALLSSNEKVWLAWLETHADNVKVVMAMSSIDGGKSWSDTSAFFNIKGKTDYPQLLQFKDAVYLVVNTEDGLKVKLMPSAH